MKAIILAGGYATRLRPISYVIPKLLFPILGKPMVLWTLEMLKAIKVDEVVLAVNYLADSLRSAVGDTYRGIRISYSKEKFPLGTAGPVRLAARLVRLKETFIVLNGDVIADIDLSQMLRRHKEKSSEVTDALHLVQDPSRFGVVALDSNGHITRFVEKPKTSEAPSRLVNAGIYFLEPKVLGMIPAGMVSLERDIFPIIAQRRMLSGYPFSGDWSDIGDFSAYKEVNFRLLRKRCPNSVAYERKTVLARNAIIKPPSFIGEGSTVESKGSVGGYAIMGKNTAVNRSARVSKSIIFDRVTIGEESTIFGAIIASNVTIGRRVKIESGSIIAPFVKVKDGVKVGKNAIIHPYKEINSDIRSGANVM